MSRLRRLAARNKFMPGPFAILSNPFYIARHGLLSAIRKAAPELNGTIVDIGCGSKPYRSIFKVERYFGVEVGRGASGAGGSKADVVYDGRHLPFANECITAVVCNQVLEHVFDPKEFLWEVNRIIVPNGKILLSVPFVWDEHEQPWDYGRYSSFGLRHLFEECGFVVLTLERQTRGSLAILQLVNGVVYKKFVSTRVIPVRVICVLLWSLVNLCGAILLQWRRSDADLYLDNVILAQKKEN